MTEVIAPSRRLLPSRRLGLPTGNRRVPEANATVVGRADLTPAVATFTIRPDDRLPPFAAGQYFSLGLPVESRLLQRPYSAASTAVDDAVELVIRLVPGGELTPRLWRQGPGDRVHLGPPKGLFRLADDDPRPHLLLATGTGIAPLVAMTAELATRPAPPTTLVVHGVAYEAELAMRERVERTARQAPWLRYAPSVSRPLDPMNARWNGLVGRIDTSLPAILEQTGIKPATAVAYVCGNPSAIMAIREALSNLGMPNNAVFSEAYWSG